MPASPYETRQKAKGHRKNGLSSLERPCECRKQKEELPAKVSGGKVAIEIAVVEGRAAIDHNPAADKRPANAHADEVPVARRPVAIGPISRDPCVSRSRARRNISYRPANADVDPDARCLCRRCAQSKGRDCQCRSQHPFLNAAHNPFIPGEPAFGSPPVRHHLWGLVSPPGFPVLPISNTGRSKGCGCSAKIKTRNFSAAGASNGGGQGDILNCMQWMPIVAEQCSTLLRSGC